MNRKLEQQLSQETTDLKEQLKRAEQTVRFISIFTNSCSLCFFHCESFVQITELRKELEVSQSDRTAVINRYIQKNFLFQTMKGFVLICSLRKVCPKR